MPDVSNERYGYSGVIFITRGNAITGDDANMIKTTRRIVHDDGLPLCHLVCETVHLTDDGSHLFLLSLGCSARYVARICSRFMEAISLLPKSQPMPIFPLSSQSSAYTPPCPARIIQALIAAPPFCHWFHLIACSEMQLQAPDVHVLIGCGPHRILAPCAWTSDGA